MTTSIMSANYQNSLANQQKFCNISIKDIAKETGLSKDSIRNAVKRLFPESIRNGVKTLLSCEQVTVLLEELKTNKTVKERMSFELTSKLVNTSTQLTPALKLKKALDLAQEAYEEEIALLKAKNQELQPKADFYDAVTSSKDTCDMAEVAKILNFKNIGRNKLYEILRNKGVLQNSNIPYQKYIDNGYFRVIETKWCEPSGDVHINLKTLVFQRGIDFIRNTVLSSKEYLEPAVEDVADKILPVLWGD